MSSVGRGVRNVFRNKARTLAVILIVGLSIGVFLTMSIVNDNISGRTVEISEDVDTTITVRPAGSYGSFSSETMDESALTIVESTEHVDTVQPQIIYMDFGDNGNQGPWGGTRPTMFMGMDPGETLMLFGGGTISITSGRTLNSGDAAEPVAIIGSGYSDRIGVNVGDSIDVNGTSVQVVGEYTTGQKFGDMSVIIPYEIAKSAFAVDGPSMVYVTVDLIGNMESVIDELRTTLGSDYDVVSLSSVMEERASALQESIYTITANSELGSLVALITAATVMIFVMILVTRERIQEIGVLKAVGFKNSRIVTQFLTESVTFATIGFVIGVVLAMLAGPYIAQAFLGASTTSGTGFPGGGGGNLIGTIDFALGWDLLIFALVLAIVLGIIGSLYPIARAVSLEPAEALRYGE